MVVVDLAATDLVVVTAVVDLVVVMVGATAADLAVDLAVVMVGVKVAVDYNIHMYQLGIVHSVLDDIHYCHLDMAPLMAVHSFRMLVHAHPV